MTMVNGIIADLRTWYEPLHFLKDDEVNSSTNR